MGGNCKRWLDRRKSFGDLAPVLRSKAPPAAKIPG